MSQDASTLLIVDNDEVFCTRLYNYFASQHIKVLVAHTQAEAKLICSTQKPDVVLLTQISAQVQADSLSNILLDSDHAKIIFLVEGRNYDGPLTTPRSEVPHCLVRNSEFDRLKEMIQKAFEDVNREKLHFVGNEIELSDTNTIIGNGGLAEAMKMIDLAASVDSPILITGETGTGKNLIARMIHSKSRLRNAPFIGINCGALPEHLIEAELFGYEKGAFTGAFKSKRGILEMAEGGTLLLDEIAEIPLHLQSKFLNVLEEKTVRRVGSVITRPVQFRIIACTSLPIESVLGTSFRKDLYYRLNVIRIKLLPLRQRTEDINELSSYFLTKIAGDANVQLSDSEIAKLKEYDWPGNVRELKNVLERAFIFRRDSSLRPSELLPSATEGQSGNSTWDGKTERRKSQTALHFGLKNSKPVTLIEMEKFCIQSALQMASSNYTQAAKYLGISLSTLRRKIKEYGLKLLVLFYFYDPWAQIFLEL